MYLIGISVIIFLYFVFMKRITFIVICLFSLNLHSQDLKSLEFDEGDHVIFLGNTFAERMIHYGYVETLLYSANPNKNLIMRNMGWSGDEITIQPRPLNFGSTEYHLTAQHADVIFLCFGFNESFKGVDGLQKFSKDLTRYISDLKKNKFNGEKSPVLILVSPIAHEDIAGLEVDVNPLNSNLAIYTEAMGNVAKKTGIYFIDLFNPTQELFKSEEEYTINGIHLNDKGYKAISEIWLQGMGYSTTNLNWDSMESARNLIKEKNKQFFYRWRAVNGEYIYGRRKEPFGVDTFPPEMEKLDTIIAKLDFKIQQNPINYILERKDIMLE